MHVLVLTIEWSYYVHGTNTIMIAPCYLRNFSWETYVKVFCKTNFKWAKYILQMFSILQHVSAHHKCHHLGVFVAVIIKLSNDPLYNKIMNSKLRTRKHSKNYSWNTYSVTMNSFNYCTTDHSKAYDNINKLLDDNMCGVSKCVGQWSMCEEYI